MKLNYLLLILLLLLMGCGNENTPVIDEIYIAETEPQLEEAVSENSIDEIEKESDQLDRWNGFYSGSDKRPDILTRFNIIVCKENEEHIGYLWMEATDQKEYTLEWKKSIRTRLESDGEQIFVYFLESFSSVGESPILDIIQPGDIMFSMNVTEEENVVLVTWEDTYIDEDELWTHELYYRDKVWSIEIENEIEKAQFLRSQGIGESDKPFYSYYDEDGEHLLDIYYDIELKRGSGISYGVNGNGNPVISGFGIGEWVSEVWQDKKFNVNDREADLSGIEDSEEIFEYNDDGKLTSYRLEGTITGWGDPFKDDIVKIEFSYREDGSLRAKMCQYNHRIFGTYGRGESHYFDKQERLVYVSAYVTHGFLEDFYIYIGDDTEPSWRLTLDHMGVSAGEIGFVKYK